MRFNAGHALNYFNVLPVAALPGVRELHIGHAIVSRALFIGMREAVREMKALDGASRAVIFGVGTDVVEIERIRKALERWGERFAGRILSPSELKRFKSHRQPANYLASASPPRKLSPRPSARHQGAGELARRLGREPAIG